MPSQTFERAPINARWLLRLRWVAVVGQLLTIFAVAGNVTLPLLELLSIDVGLNVTLPLLELLSIVGFTAFSNVGFAVWVAWRERQDQPSADSDRGHLAIAAVLAVDLLLLTALLYFTGGPANPFAVFYFVNLSLAAVILPARWSWGLTGLAIICFGLLLLRHEPLPALNRQLGENSLFPGRTFQQVGLGVALVTCAGVVTYFITRVTRELEQREAQLREAEQKRARSERLEALATLAAGAGHELASPLSTIAVIAKDLTKHLEGSSVPASVLEDVALIRSELDQCRQILDGMTSSAGQATGETIQPIEVPAFVDEIISAIRRRDQVQVAISPDARHCKLFVPLAATAQALRGIVRNAIDVSSFGEPVELLAHSNQSTVSIVVRDRGPGMPPAVLARAGDPFFTTKEPGEGMGLGLFLARNVVERIGGDLMIESTPGKGTTVTVKLNVRPD